MLIQYYNSISQTKGVYFRAEFFLKIGVWDVRGCVKPGSNNITAKVKRVQGVRRHWVNSAKSPNQPA